MQEKSKTTCQTISNEHIKLTPLKLSKLGIKLDAEDKRRLLHHRQEQGPIYYISFFFLL